MKARRHDPVLDEAAGTAAARLNRSLLLGAFVPPTERVNLLRVKCLHDALYEFAAETRREREAAVWRAAIERAQGVAAHFITNQDGEEARIRYAVADRIASLIGRLRDHHPTPPADPPADWSAGRSAEALLDALELAAVPRLSGLTVIERKALQTRVGRLVAALAGRPPKSATRTRRNPSHRAAGIGNV